MQLVANVGTDRHTNPQGQKKSLNYMLSKEPRTCLKKRPSQLISILLLCAVLNLKTFQFKKLTYFIPVCPLGVTFFVFYQFKFSAM